MLPRRRRMVPVIAASSVDLTAPLGPSSATVSPLSTERATPCRTSAGPYDACTSDSRSIAEVGLPDGGVRADLVRQPVGDLAAEIEHRDAVRERQEKAHVVLDQEHRDAPPRDAADDRRQALELRRR